MTNPDDTPPTGYGDAYGNIWAFNTGHTVIEGVTIRGQAQRKMLEPGAYYWDTSGVLRRVPPRKDDAQ